MSLVPEALGAVIGLWLGIRFTGPAHLIRTITGRRRRLPTPAHRPEGYTVAGETWPTYVPAEPMPHVLAGAVERVRNRMAVDEPFRRYVEGMRGRPAAYGCAVHEPRKWCLTHAQPAAACQVRR